MAATVTELRALPAQRRQTDDAVAATLSRRGWRMHVRPGRAVEFTRDGVRVYLPRDGQSPRTVEQVDQGGARVWGADLDPDSPPAAVLAVADTALALAEVAA